MKHILLATTALVATAGVASADIALSGSAEMGIFGGDGIETQFHTDVDVTFTMSGETDNGLSFGASVDLDEGGSGADAHADDTEDGGATIFVAYGPVTLTMGDVDGAFDAAMKEAIIGSAIADDHEHGGYNGNSGFDGAFDGQIAQLKYTASSFTGYLSVEQDETGTFDPIWGLGVTYSAELAGLSLGVGLGYQTAEDVSVWGLSVDTTFNNGIQGILNYSEMDLNTGTNQSHVGVAFGYSMNALTVGVNYGKFTDLGGLSGLDSSGYGLAVNYDLGGGLEAQFGYGNSELEFGGASVDADSWSLGLAMSF